MCLTHQTLYKLHLQVRINKKLSQLLDNSIVIPNWWFAWNNSFWDFDFSFTIKAHLSLKTEQRFSIFIYVEFINIYTLMYLIIY